VFVGVVRWQGRVWSLVSRLISQRNASESERSCSLSADVLRKVEDDVFNARNFALKEASDWKFCNL